MNEYTQEAYDDLLGRINECRESLQAAKLRMGKTAQEDTWHDNAAFDQAQEEVRNLMSLLSSLEEQTKGVAIVSGSGSDKVGIGSTVVVMYEDDEDDCETFILDGRATTDTIDSVSRISTSSPIGAALLGHRVGDQVSYTVPSGHQCSLRVVQVH